MASLDFNYIVSSLPEFVKNNPELISKQLAFGSPTVKRLTPRTGIKTSESINFLSVNTPIQDGKGCGYDPAGTAELTDRIIKTAILKKEISICPDTLLGKWAEYEVGIPADKRGKLPFEAFLVAELIKETSEQMEDLVWQGKSTEYGGTDLMNGFLAIVENDTTAIHKNVSGSAYSIVRQVISALPTKVKREQPKIFVSPEFFEQLSFELVDANLYHFKPEDNLDSIIFPGTRYEVVSTYGLSGTGKIFASTEKNMFYGCDTEDAERRVKVVYDEKADTFAVRFRWNAGVQVAFPDRCVVATIVGDVVSASSIEALNKLAGTVNADNQIEVKQN